MKKTVTVNFFGGPGTGKSTTAAGLFTLLKKKGKHCEGGFIYDEPEARVALQLWILHPRKGASRGVYIKNIEENEVSEVIQYLKSAAERNANRFSKL